MKSEVLKYIEGKMDDSEKRKILEWINSDKERQKRFNLLKAEYIKSKLRKLFEDIDIDDNITKR